MAWLRKLAQNVSDTYDLSRREFRQNPDIVYSSEVYRAPPPYDHVFLGGEDDYAEAEELVMASTGQSICSSIDCRDFPETGSRDFDDTTGRPQPLDISKIQPQFDALVTRLISKISTANCPIFVYCELGANRSVAVLSTALSQLMPDKSFEDVFHDIKQTRSLANVQDIYYVLGLKYNGTSDSEQQVVDELDQDWEHDWPDLSLKLPEDADLYRDASNWLTRVAQEDLTEEQYDFEPHVQEFGVTPDFTEAGYIMPDGRMLDFSQKDLGGRPGTRTLDHRRIGPTGSSEEMLEFMRRTGAVRINPNGSSAGIDFFGRLTSQQKRAINGIVSSLDYFAVDIRSSNGDIEFTQDAKMQDADRRNIDQLWARVQRM